MKGKEGGRIYLSNPGTFEINLSPTPEFSYFSTNFLAGTPVYNMSKEGLSQAHSQVKLFSQCMEVPYTLLNRPKVLVIGAGGGRDIFMAHTHGAAQIIGAEINPGIVKEMSPGGKMYDYSGRIYTSENTKVYTIDGRHLVKTLPSNSMDLIVLNGVDTFSGLSSGAYAYAESYLYTKNAMEDYLRVLKDGGMINLYRWAFPSMPREELRLHAIALSALKSIGAQKPWEHIVIGLHNSWAVILIKKMPFTSKERITVEDYLTRHQTAIVYPAPDILKRLKGPLMTFDMYVDYFKKDAQASFEKYYPYDISVITDDNPFFYKYYRLSSFNPFHTFAYHHTGPVVFLTQALILLQAIIFILLFIFVPLLISKKEGIKRLPAKTTTSFITFFACLGTGFMLIEIPLMQRFVLLLGSPIYSLSVVLAVLLAATGVGSLIIGSLDKNKMTELPLTYVTFVLVSYLVVLILAGTRIYDFFIQYSFVCRILLISLLIIPIGVLLGAYFPSGLRLVSQDNKDAVAWAWGINCGFSVLGSILSIIIAQFLGFNVVMALACVLYLMAILAFKHILKML
jgi:spermidine synthase